MLSRCTILWLPSTGVETWNQPNWTQAKWYTMVEVVVAMTMIWMRKFNHYWMFWYWKESGEPTWDSNEQAGYKTKCLLVMSLYIAYTFGIFQCKIVPSLFYFSFIFPSKTHHPFIYSLKFIWSCNDLMSCAWIFIQVLNIGLLQINKWLFDWDWDRDLLQLDE